MGQMTGLLIYGGSLGDFYALAMQLSSNGNFMDSRMLLPVRNSVIINRRDKIMQFYLDSLKGRMCLI